LYKNGISIEHVVKKFGNLDALIDVNLEIKKGEFFSLLGPSGCGKTTLLRIIGGFESPSDGVICLEGENVLHLPPNKRQVNTIFQNYALFPHLSVFENVAFPLRLKKNGDVKIKGEVEKYLNLVKLDTQMNKYPSQLSGCQKQRVAIARALINKPKVLLLDEPLSALDAKLRQHMLIELDTIHHEIGITFIYVTHDQNEAMSVSDRLAVMNEGKVLQVGTPHEIYEKPANDFVASFIGEANFIRGRVLDVEEKYASIDVEHLGTLHVYLDKPVKTGDMINLTIRPEKIRITRDKPAQISEKSNLLYGRVEDLIYTGFQSKFFVQMNEKFNFKVFKQHIQYYLDETVINWNDHVYIWWNADDGFILEVEEN